MLWPCLLLVALAPSPLRPIRSQLVTHFTRPSPRHPRVRCVVDNSEVHARLTLIRHGQSEWNLANRFTGWVDVDLTERGITEARQAGRILATAGEQHDLVVTSCLRRAIRTACLVLSTTDQCWLPLVKDARLNEQHSGALTGNNKRALADQHGVDQVMKWRRTYDCPPPQLSADHPVQRVLNLDERYRDAPLAVPQTESLHDTTQRVNACWEEQIVPALKAGKNVLVVSHGNTLRALVKLVDNVSEKDSFHLDLPTACPVVYELNSQLRPVGVPEGFWGKSDATRYGRFLMSNKKVLQAQEAMRLQVVQDIAVSTVSPTSNQHGLAFSDPDAIATCAAWTPESATSRITTLNGQSYNVRETPPSYFALESERIRRQAKSEVEATIATFQRAHKARGVAAAAATETMNGKPTQTQPQPSQPPQPPQPKCMLIILRHGYSEYNAENRFTGWADVELSNQGREEARLAGSVLREAGVRRLEKVYSSYLKRAIKTAWLMLDELEMQWVPIEYTWRLNERHYGALQGRPKRQCSSEFGGKQVQQWRRGISHTPPPWEVAQELATVDRRYEGIAVPETESLADCSARLQPFLEEELKPAMRSAMRRVTEEDAEAEAEVASVAAAAATVRPSTRIPTVRRDRKPSGRARLATMESAAAFGSVETRGARGVPTFVISSSENLIRALVTELDGVPDADVPLLDIPYATPLVYEFDEDLNPIQSPLAMAPLRHGYYLGCRDRLHDVQRDIRESIAVETDGGSDGENCFRVDDGDEVRWVCE